MMKHICTLEIPTVGQLPPLPENANILQRLRRKLYWSTFLSEDNPNSSIYYRNNNNWMQNYRAAHIRSKFSYIIHPVSLFRYYYETWMSLVYLVSFVVQPLFVCFHYHATRSLDVTAVVSYFLDLCCWIDIILNFYTGYVPNPCSEDISPDNKTEESQGAVVNPAKIAKRYVKSGYFYIDVLSSCPIKLLFFLAAPSKDSSFAIKLANSLHFLKILRLNTCIEYFSTVEHIFLLDRNVKQCLHIMVVTVLIFHWNACLAYLFPVLLAEFGPLKGNSWAQLSGVFEMETVTDKYVLCLYRSSIIFVGVDYGQFDAMTTEDLIYGIVYFIVGNLYCSYQTIKLLQIISSMLLTETKYQEIINQLQQYMSVKQMSAKMQKRIIQCYEYKYRKSYFRASTLYHLLSDKLRKDITLHTRRSLVSNVKIFQGLPENILDDIINCLEYEIYMPNDLIMKAGTLGTCMYFLLNGTVAVYSQGGKEICHLQDYSYFGEIELITKSSTRLCSIVALEKSGVYKLEQRHFKRCFLYAKEVYEEMEATAKIRLANLKKNDARYKEFVYSEIARAHPRRY